MLTRRKRKKELKKCFLALEKPNSLLAEQYRTIRNNIFFSKNNKYLQTIMFISAGPNHEKTATVTNMAVMFSNEGKKVLLIDSNLRKPRLTPLFDMDKQLGLTNVLKEEIDLNEAVRKSKFSNLWVLPAGPKTINAPELLNSNAMQELILDAKKKFDLIIFDTPPLLNITDAQIIGQFVEGAIFVVKGKKTEKEQLVRSKELLKRADIPLIGSILRNIEHKYGKLY